MVAVDGSDWGLEKSDVIIKAGEGLGEDGQRMVESQIVPSVAWTYEN